MQPTATPVIAAIALRVRDAAAAYQRAIERGAWAVPTHVEVMELNIGHFLIGEAVFVGLKEAIAGMRRRMEAAREG